jgi:hypothetical protein
MVTNGWHVLHAWSRGAFQRGGQLVVLLNRSLDVNWIDERWIQGAISVSGSPAIVNACVRLHNDGEPFLIHGRG